MKNKPNVLLLTIDTLRADMLGCYGHESLISPNIDRLATSSLRFGQVISGGSWTQAAFPVIFTSSYASMYGGCLGPLAPERPSPIEWLAKNGYTTGGFSTSPLLSRLYEYHRGFQHFIDLNPDESDPFLRKIKGGERLLRQQFTHYISQLIRANSRPSRPYVCGEVVTAKAANWLKNVESPFFAWVHYMDIHWPYHFDGRLTHPRDISQAWRDLDHLHKVNWNEKIVSPAQKARYMNLYKQAVQYVDLQVGKLISELEKLNRLENTIIVIVSDHGEEFLEHGRWGHWENNLYDEILKVPLIIKFPGLSKGIAIQRQVRLLDLMPTLLDICDLPHTERIEGKSFASLWDPKKNPYEVTYSISEMIREDWHKIAIRSEKHKYIWDNKNPDQPELYNLVADPGELNNIFEGNPHLARDYQGQIEKHIHYISITQPSIAYSPVEIDEKVTNRLRDLGYVE
jgi:arylsulfatase A-like enzyme